ncbi:MAG: hypothetical protein AB2L18_08565 [Anaerolineaceae bacterium]
MNKKIILISVLVASLLLSACATQTAEAAPEAEVVVAEPALTLSGAMEAAWTADELKAMTMVDADYTNKDGETTKFSGVPIVDLLTAAGVTDYATITLVASDGFSADVTKDELAACANCIVAFDDDGSLRSVMPGLASKQNVKGLVEISVQ